MVVDDIAGKLRFSLRTAGFVGLTFSLYGMLELDTAVSAPEQRNPILYKWMQRYGQGLLRLYGIDVIARGPHVDHGERYPGTDDRGIGRIFVMNHRSGLDVPITLAFFEATIVSRADLAHWPVIGVAARRVGTLFVDRSSKRSGAAVINAICTALRRGRAVMVYPEGTTFAGDEVRPFRPGAFLAAQQTGAEIVPVGLAYAGEGAAFMEESFVSHMLRVSSAPKIHAALVIGKPLRCDSTNIDNFRDHVRAAVQQLVHEARNDLGQQ